ncbi:hypothetical protein DdX_05440 [Ditylenchus destructor]|uniref:Uncharacterized protein n=1 Tax=Ditylenchus destructor TaxID=166010 RepID=A0AAD4R6M8_9BILA|nr:hypothetical protein DdX_05440 [Ditylenchus destructor]
MDDDLMEFVSNSYCDDDHISTVHRQDYARNIRFTNDHRFTSTFSTSSGMSSSVSGIQRQPNYIENSPFNEHDFVEDDLQEISPPNSFSASPSKFQNRRPVQVIKRSVMHAPGHSNAPANVVRYNRAVPSNRQMIGSGAKTTTFRTVNQHIHEPQNSSLSNGTGTRIVLVPSRNIGMGGRDRQTADSTTIGGMSRGVIKIDRNTGNKFIQFPNGSVSLIQKNRPLPQLQVGRTSSPHSRLMFDFDEEKEREISEAIAREEELMRLEEERTKAGKRGDSASWTRPLARNVPMTQRFQTQRFIGRNDRVGHSTSPYQSPTQLNSWDTEISRACKSVLAGIVNRICASEEQQNRFVNISRTANNKFSDAVTLGNVRHSMPHYVQPAPVHRVYPLQYRQPEDFLVEYIESYKREVNTLRANLENIAQDELGICMPWRRSRTKGTREKVTTDDAVLKE